MDVPTAIVASDFIPSTHLPHIYVATPEWVRCYASGKGVLALLIDLLT